MIRRLGWWLAPLLLVVTPLVLLLVLVHGSASSRWLLQQLPGVTVQGFSGTLAGDWQVERLQHESAGQSLELRGLQLRWRATCLIRAQLCLDELQAESLSWRDSAAAENAPESVQLPQLRLPLSIVLGQLRLGELQVQDARLFSDLSLRARLDRQGLQIDQLSLVRDRLKASAQGLLQLQGDWPLELQLQAQLPEVQGREWHLQGRLGGSLQQRLQLQLDSHGYLDAQLQGWLQPLQAQLPLQLELRSVDFKVHAELPAQLHLQRMQLELTGDLQQGYRLQGQASLPAEQSAIGVALLARLDALGADLTQLRLQAADPTQTVALQGRLDWAHALAGTGRLQWQNFPWQRLWPGVEVPVSLQQLQAELVYADAAYRADWQAQLNGPAGPFKLSSQTRGTLQQVQFEQLQLRAGQGRADGRLQLDFAEGLSWQGELQVQALDPGYWLAELPGELQGLLSGSGSYRRDLLAAEMVIDLQGRLRGQPTRFKASLDGAGQKWQASQLDLRLGDNRINGRLALDRKLDGLLDLQLQNLAQIGPGLGGQMNGRLNLAGSLAEPQGQLQLQGKRLQYADLRLQQLNLQGNVAAGQRGQLQFKAEGLQRGDLQLGKLQLNASGTPVAHEISLQLDGKPLQIALQANAGVVASGWAGQLARGQIEFSDQQWRLQAPMPLTYTAGTLRFGAHCWMDAPASLCSQGLQVLPQATIEYRLREFPMQRLQGFWSEDFDWDAQAQADIDLQLGDQGPLGRLDVQVAAGNLRVREEGEWLLLPYEQLQLNSRLTPRAINSKLQFRAPELGRLELQAQLDPGRPDLPMRGSYLIQDVDVAALRPFFPLLSELAGSMQGQGELSGSLLAPVASGHLRLRDGRVAGETLPLTIEQLQLDMQLVGQRMLLNGHWQSGEQGRARLQGELNWREALTLDLQLNGSHLPLVIEPSIHLQIEPDLQLQLREQRVSVSGKVAIPSGQISLHEIPPQAVRRSPDARIVNAATEPKTTTGLAIDVELDVGSDRLVFRGLGLSADVHGRMRVSDNLTGQGQLQLSNGRFNAWGQRLTIRRARLLFVGPLDQPHLDIEAVRRVGGVIAGVRVTGRADRPLTEVFSEPPMSEQQALSYLVLGRPMGGGENSALTQAAVAIGMSSSVPITGPLAERLAVRDLEVGYDGVGARMFSDRLTVRYGIDAMQPDRVLTLRYELTRRLYMEAASGLSSSLDLVYRRDF